jgi:hypothetical protein
MTGLNDGFDQPHGISPIEMAFPANVLHLMPRFEDIPDEFRTHYGTKESAPWIKFQSDWFFRGTSKNALKPRAGVDVDAAWRHLAAIQGSFEPKHEHKVAAVAWLASRWFAEVKS